MMRKMMATASALWLTVAAAGVALAAPGMLTYSGQLEELDGTPYDGDASVQVTVWDSLNGGTQLWSQDLGTVNVINGLMRVSLMGSGLSDVVMANDGLWLEWTVAGETLLPRQKLNSVAFAMSAGNTANLGGVAAGAFLQTTEDIPPANLPTDGIGQVSNHALNNEFVGVDWKWTGSINIEDYPALGGQTTVDTTETGDSYLTAITIYTKFNLDLNSNITLVLNPPTATGVGAITLIPDEPELTAGLYTNAWTTAEAPALANLLGQKVEGTWTLTLTDTTDDGGDGLIVGQLLEFEVVYDVVRSDHMQVAGRLDVATDLNVGGDATVTGPARGDYLGYSGFCSVQNTTNGFQKYCLDSTVHNTLGDHIAVDPSGSITFLKAGYYRVESRLWVRGNCTAILQGRYMLNGTSIRMWENEREGNRPKSGLMVETRWFAVGDVLHVESDPNCGTSPIAYTNGEALGNLSVRYMGH
jgi:hypothetical protein